MASEVWVPAVEAVIKVGSSYMADGLCANLSTIIANRSPDIAVLVVTRWSQIRTLALKFKRLGVVAPRGYPAATTSMDKIDRPRRPYLAKVTRGRNVCK